MATVMAATTRAGNASLPLACQFLPAINHPRYPEGIVWLHLLGSGKRPARASKKAKQNQAMTIYDE
jgi:hypothetical protein